MSAPSYHAGRELRRFTISRALALIFVAVALISSVVVFFSSYYIKERSISQIAGDEARKTSELIFLNLYGSMKRGWSKADIESIVVSVQETLPDTEVHLYRGSRVRELYGEGSGKHSEKPADERVKEVFETAAPMLVEQGRLLRFLYPMVVEQECLGCHANAKVGDVNGIIEVLLPTEQLRVPLEFTISSVTYIFTLAILLLGVLIFYSVRRFLLRPVEQLSRHTRTFGTHSGVRLPDIDHSFHEISSLHDNFNQLLDQLDGAYSEIKRQSERDSLTKLYNRRKLEQLAEVELSRSRRHQYSLAILLLDLDRFKPINDLYGHEAGDEMLVEVSRALLDNVRKEDVCARIGGDEFVVMLPETDRESAMSVVEHLKSAVRSLSIERRGESLQVEVSIGVAVYSGEELDEIDMLMGVADREMYADKARGR